jgi:hypothetical protein
MRRYIIALSVLLWAATGAAEGLAQVKMVQMKIDGYLCGF